MLVESAAIYGIVGIVFVVLLLLKRAEWHLLFVLLGNLEVSLMYAPPLINKNDRR